MTNPDAYTQRLREPDKAMAIIEAGNLVYLNVGTPMAVAELLNSRIQELGSVDLRMLGPGYLPLVESERDAGEREIEIFVSAGQRAVRTFFEPCSRPCPSRGSLRAG